MLEGKIDFDQKNSTNGLYPSYKIELNLLQILLLELDSIFF